MEIIKIDKDYIANDKSVIALGNFDGVHLGHRELLKTLVSKAKELNMKSSILIFKEHTKNFIYKEKQFLLTSNEEKYRIFEEIGIDIVYEIIFNEDIMTMTPEYFAEDFLFNNLKINSVIVGFDYTFGYKASGNIEILKELCEKNNIDLNIIKPVEIEGDLLSSTYIRNLIKSGQVDKANKLLGHCYTIDGYVIHGKQLGNKMGYPTANIEPDVKYVIPMYGVYDSDIIIDGKVYKAATNIGKNPTIENEGLRVEAHILNFSESIYGKKVALRLIKFLRPEIKFDTVDELFKQIAKDVKDVENR
ncbi:bifunctional riboflavin kinase/FAD synthetase [Peptoniphilus stercorisuis]|uniref:Riboflavin biosynthesis protein n=1 Tax=Peptoniphilus stercorisuis TaxID=1436965 RepID=A0ABS4KCI4_9FIRM|nr:bifunctional riboflavin kinase/FAD synthetase [Peptoniphilus stercorisuis]MBP2025497.1 riboflavin kinase/FMN adenylyltransferase [Peptoniphilus stercorisuis]